MPVFETRILETEPKMTLLEPCTQQLLCTTQQLLFSIIFSKYSFTEAWGAVCYNKQLAYSIQITVCVVCVQSCFSRVRLCATLWTMARQVLCPWNSPGKNTEVDCCPLLQGIFLTYGDRTYISYVSCTGWRVLYH